MCILFIAIDAHPDYPLIICANRDEFHHRPTAPAHFWQPDNHIVAGKDLQAGGSWLGVNRDGIFASLTNIRVPERHSDDLKSRGELITKALASNSIIDSNWLKQHAAKYNPFNLIFGQHSKLHCFNSLTKEITELTSGFHAISNGAMDDIWPKMAKGERSLEALIQQKTSISIDELIELMKDESQPQDNQLPETGIALEWERRLSSIYIRHPEYGTRSTSIVIRDNQGHFQFSEVRYDGKGRQLGRQDFVINDNA